MIDSVWVHVHTTLKAASTRQSGWLETAKKLVTPDMAADAVEQVWTVALVSLGVALVSL